CARTFAGMPLIFLSNRAYSAVFGRVSNKIGEAGDRRPMEKMAKRRVGWLLLVLATGGVGCNRQDSQKLANVGRKGGEKAEALTGGSSGRLASGWQTLRADMDKMALDARVSARIRWDKSLERTKIQVFYHDGQIELKGQVKSFDQRQRAVQLANATVGADSVVDSLEVTPDLQ